MRFEYLVFEDSTGHIVARRPFLPIILSFKGKKLPVINLLADTGADETILPLELAELLSVRLDLDSAYTIFGAGGGEFDVYRSEELLDFCIPPQRGFSRPLKWKAHVSFTKEQPTPLLGHKECLEKFRLNFDGPQHCFTIE